MSHIDHPPEKASLKRQALPNRRASTFVGFEIEGQKFTASASYFPDGSLAEVFLNAGKHSSSLDASVRDSAVLCSIALQFGAPAEVIRHALSSPSPLGTAIQLLSEE